MVETSAAAMVLTAAEASGPACVTAPRGGYRKSKQGVILSGAGTATADGWVARVGIAFGRMAWWVGDERRSVEEQPDHGVPVS